MKITSLSILVSLFASQATALSCMRPDPALSFQQMEQVPEDVYVLRGVLEFDESLLPQGVINEEHNPEPIPAMFKGQGLTLDGFTSRFERPVILQSLCFGPWCGSAASGQEVVTFAKVVGDDVVLETDPCGSKMFFQPTQATVDILMSCIRGERCEGSEF